MKPGEIWRGRIPFAAGHAQAGERPALILQDASFSLSLPTVLIVPFTGTGAAARFPGTLAIAPDASNGLTMPSVALVFQMRALDWRDCLSKMGELQPDLLDQILKLLDQLLGR